MSIQPVAAPNALIDQVHDRLVSAIADGSSSGWTTRSWHIDAERAVHPIPKVLAWLGRHPRWTFHFTPTSSSWLNAVETFFSALTRRRIRRGSFRSVVDLQAAINRYIAEHNTAPKPFTWTKPADQILATVNRLNASLH